MTPYARLYEKFPELDPAKLAEACVFVVLVTREVFPYARNADDLAAAKEEIRGSRDLIEADLGEGFLEPMIFLFDLFAASYLSGPAGAVN